MTKLNNISRTLVGALFIVSGLIKANDAVGFAFKLNDYFAADVLDLPFLIDYTYPLAVFICISEIHVGLICFGWSNHEINCLVTFIHDFIFDALTFYSAYFNKVTDCGCFGDALN